MISNLMKWFLVFYYVKKKEEKKTQENMRRTSFMPFETSQLCIVYNIAQL